MTLCCELTRMNASHALLACNLQVAFGLFLVNCRRSAVAGGL